MAVDPWAEFEDVQPSAPRPTLKERDIMAGIDQSGASAASSAASARRSDTLLPADAEKAAAEARKLQLETEKLEREAAQGPALTGDKRAELKDTLTSLKQFENDLGLLETSFDKNFEDQGLATPREYLPGMLSPTNQAYNAASNRLLPLVARALGFTSKQMDTPSEIERLKSYVPTNTDSDQTAREKLTALRGMLDRQRENAATQLGQVAPGDGEQPPAVAGAVDIGAGPTLPGADGGGNIVPPAGPTPPQFSPGDPQMQAATGDTRRVADPQLQGQMDAMLRQGASFSDINAFAMSKGAEPINRQQYLAVRNFLRKNPNYEGSLVDVNRYEPVSLFEKNVTAVGNNSGGSYLLGAGQMLSANTLDDLAADPQRANLALAMAQAQSPTATGLGQMSGATLAALSGEAGLARLGMAPGLVRGALADVGMGAASGAGAAGDGDRAMGALQGAGYAGLGSAGGSALGAGLRRVGTGVADPSVHAMAAEGVPLTIGQVYGQSGLPGRIVKGIEDRIEGFPFIGAAVNARRRGGYDVFNTKTFERALKPIDGSVGGKVGEDAVLAAQGLVDAAYTKALAGKVVQIDNQFARDLSQAVTKVAGLSRVGPEVLEDVKAVFDPFKTGSTFTGPEMQIIKRDLEKIKRNYRNDPRGEAVRKAVDEVKDAVFGIFRRQTPEVVPDYQKADMAYRRLSTVEDAVLAGKNTKGKFTPAQLGTADRASTVKFEGKRAAARGDSPFHDFQRDAQNVLPNEVPDSGTAGRLAAGMPATAAGLTLAGILGAAYTKAGQRLLTKPGRGVENEMLKKALTDERTRLLLGKAGAGTGAALGLGTYPGP